MSTDSEQPVFFEPDGVTLQHHVAWTAVGGPGPGIRADDIPEDGAPMEWQIPGQSFWDL